MSTSSFVSNGSICCQKVNSPDHESKNIMAKVITIIFVLISHDEPHSKNAAMGDFDRRTALIGFHPHAFWSLFGFQ